VPKMAWVDGINATKLELRRMWFNKATTGDGIEAYLDALALCEDRDVRNLARFVGRQGLFINAAANMSRMAFHSAGCMRGA
jgi:hypothetical protein